MKATTLIEKLSDAVDFYGDMEVYLLAGRDVPTDLLRAFVRQHESERMFVVLTDT